MVYHTLHITYSVDKHKKCLLGDIFLANHVILSLHLYDDDDDNLLLQYYTFEGFKHIKSFFLCFFLFFVAIVHSDVLMYFIIINLSM